MITQAAVSGSAGGRLRRDAGRGEKVNVFFPGCGDQQA